MINLVSENTIEHKMLGTLKFKQGLADYVLDARGDSADFETKDARGAFMARLAEVMDSPVHVSIGSSREKSSPKEDRLHIVLSKEGAGVERCDVIESDTGVPEAVLTVGREVAADRMRALVQESSGVSLPPSRVVAVSPAELELLKKLESLGFITINSAKTRTIFDRMESAPPAPSKEFLKRCARAEEQNRIAERDIRMAEVLLSGDFQAEALAASRKSVCSAAAGLFILSDQVAPDVEISVMTDEMLEVLKKDVSIDRSLIAVLQSAYFGLEADVTLFVNSAKEFLACCVQQLETRRLRPF